MLTCIQVTRERNSSRNESLSELILSSLLKDFDLKMDAIRLAVKWGQPRVIRRTLQQSYESDLKRLSRALEEALVMKNEKVIEESLFRSNLELNLD